MVLFTEFGLIRVLWLQTEKKLNLKWKNSDWLNYKKNGIYWKDRSQLKEVLGQTLERTGKEQLWVSLRARNSGCLFKVLTLDNQTLTNFHLHMHLRFSFLKRLQPCLDHTPHHCGGKGEVLYSYFHKNQWNGRGPVSSKEWYLLFVE